MSGSMGQKYRNPLISVITPTYRREADLIRQYANFKAQTYPMKEWMILDDSPAPSSFFLALSDPEVRYIYSPIRLSVGEKRNLLIEKASGFYIAHFDDDDYYAPQYLKTMARHLKTLDFIKLSAWYVYSEPHLFWGYCDHEHPAPFHYYLSPGEGLCVIENFQQDPSMLWGYGFSYAYRRTVWEAFPFEAVNFGEDHGMVLERLLPSRFSAGYVSDPHGIVLHILHQGNASQAFPQYRLPPSRVPAILMASVVNQAGGDCCTFPRSA